MNRLKNYKKLEFTKEDAETAKVELASVLERYDVVLQEKVTEAILQIYRNSIMEIERRKYQADLASSRVTPNETSSAAEAKPPLTRAESTDAIVGPILARNGFLTFSPIDCAVAFATVSTAA